MLLVVIFAGLLWWFASGHWQVFSPKGLIAREQRSLIAYSILLMLLIVLPIFGMTIYIARKYRADNKEAKYTPEWDHNTELQFVWWAAPTIIVFLLGILAWKSSHRLDPRQPIQSSTPGITIQVVALEWKWLFIYPEQNIATVNFVEFPVNAPVKFELTADAPMNSFWIPQLGGQMYAMAGMTTELNLMADRLGEFSGTAAEINGAGFAGMKFVAKAATQDEFNQWVQETRQSSPLTSGTYDQLAKPSENNPTTYYSSVSTDLFNQIIHKYMPEGHTH